jgi:hypothetical protein
MYVISHRFKFFLQYNARERSLPNDAWRSRSSHFVPRLTSSVIPRTFVFSSFYVISHFPSSYTLPLASDLPSSDATTSTSGIRQVGNRSCLLAIPRYLSHILNGAVGIGGLVPQPYKIRETTWTLSFALAKRWLQAPASESRPPFDKLANQTSRHHDHSAHTNHTQEHARRCTSQKFPHQPCILRP